MSTARNEQSLDIRSFSSKVFEAKGLTPGDLQKNAIQKLSGLSVPSTRDEDWKYTNLKKFFVGDVRVPEGSSQGIEAPEAITQASNRLVVINGKFSDALSNIVSDSQAISIIPSGESLPECFVSYRSNNNAPNQLVTDSRGTGVFAPKNNKAPESASTSGMTFPLLNDLCLENIVVFDIPEGATESVEITYITCLDSYKTEVGGVDNSIMMASPRVFIRAGKKSKLDITEHFISFDNTSHITNHCVELVINEEARVTHTKIQREAIAALHISNIFSDQGSRSVYKNINLNFGSKVSRNEIYPRITAPEVEAWLIGSSVLSGDQQVDNFTVIDHIAPGSESHELYKGLYSDNSTGVFSGTIIVQREAQKTNAYQSNSSLLLSDSAESYSRPQLRIWADDVKCSHGATVGQLDEDALFYLKARGIPDQTARLILTKAYISEVMSHIEDPVLNQFVEMVIDEKIDQVTKSSL